MRMKKGFSDPPRRFDGTPKPKRAVNLSVDAEILADAKAMNLNLSQILEDELRARVRQARIDRFSEENKATIEWHNRLIEENGVWSEEYRDW